LPVRSSAMECGYSSFEARCLGDMTKAMYRHNR
jgi:hypothetical protein